MLTVAMCLTFPLALTANEPGKLREIDVKGIKIVLEKGKIDMPKVIKSAEELAKAIPDSDAIKKQVDFTKDDLVLFAWSGSGGDKISARFDAMDKKTTFTYSLGLTRDLRRHVHLFAIPKFDFTIEKSK